MLKNGIDKIQAKTLQERIHVLIQFERIPTVEEREELKREGVNLLSYIPNKAWYVLMLAGKAGELAVNSIARAMDEILPNHSYCLKI